MKLNFLEVNLLKTGVIQPNTNVTDPIDVLERLVKQF